jgi:hypothetical protein
MAFPKPKHSKTTINRAGQTLLTYVVDLDKKWGREELRAMAILSNFRSCHGYPINTFQATLRNKIATIDKSALVMQRLKRLPSIVMKLDRFSGMRLARMQDIGGLRAVTVSLKKAYLLQDNYLRSQFKHTLHLHRDYINNPKISGYRSIHLVYKYKNTRVPEYDGLFVELQIRTRMQHYWATAVETMGTYLEHSLKSSEGPKEWLDFFSLAGSAFAHLEKTPPVPGYEHLSSDQTYRNVVDTMGKLDVISKLAAFTIATKRVVTDKKQGAYHLVVLDLEKKQVRIHSYPKSDLEHANKHYIKIEREAQRDKHLQVVLVSAGSIKDLKKAYPNYFLDTRKFIDQLNVITKIANKSVQRTG